MDFLSVPCVLRIIRDYCFLAHQRVLRHHVSAPLMSIVMLLCQEDVNEFCYIGDVNLAITVDVTGSKIKVISL